MPKKTKFKTSFKTLEKLWDLEHLLHKTLELVGNDKHLSKKDKEILLEVVTNYVKKELKSCKKSYR